MAVEPNLNFDPSFGDPIERLRAAAEAQGIHTHFLSGVRSAEDQRQLYANYLAGQKHQPLPYPERGAVPLAAVPGTSLHERGLAADLSADDPGQQAALWALAPKFGLKALGASDPNHFQLRRTAMASGPHPLVVATAASDGAPSPVDLRTSVYQSLIGRGLSPQQAVGAMYSMMGESGSRFDPASYNPNDPGGSIGFANWNGTRRAGLQAVAKSMGVSETDPSAQVAYFNKEIGPGGEYASVIDNIKKNATSAADATRIWTGEFERPKVNNWQSRYAQGAQVASLDANGAPVWKTAPAATASAGGPPTSVGDALAKLTTEDAKGQTPLDKLQATMKPKEAPRVDAPMLQAPQDQTAMLAPAAQQLLAQTMAVQAKPLMWSSSPYGAGTAGQQIPGMTLNGNLYG